MKRGGVFKSSLREPDHFDGTISIAATVQVVQSVVNRMLLEAKRGPGVSPLALHPLQPDMAESWSQPDSTTLIFKLRPGIKFENRPPTNGREVTAEDVVYSISRAATRKDSAFLARLTSLKEVKALDRYTVQLTLSEPYAPIATVMAHTATAIRAKEAASPDGDFKLAERLIGTGPFMLKENVAGVRVVFVKNPDYWKKGLPYLDGLELIYIIEPSTVQAALRTGKIDYRMDFPYGQDQVIDMKKTRPDIKTEEYPGGFIATAMWWRVDKPPFNDVRVRRAVSLALDRQAIIRDYFRGEGEISTDLMFIQKEWVDIDKLPGEALKYLKEYNPAEARQLLAQAGYPEGFKTTITSTPTYRDIYYDLMPIVQKYLADVGIIAEAKPIEYGAWLTGPLRGKYEGGIQIGRTTPGFDPDDFTYALHYPGLPLNHILLDDAVLNPLLLQQRQTVDVQKRREIVQQIVARTASQAYRVYLPLSSWYLMYQPWVKDFYPKVMTLYDAGGLESTWLAK